MSSSMTTSTSRWATLMVSIVLLLVCAPLPAAAGSGSRLAIYVGWDVGDISQAIRRAADAGWNVIILEFWMVVGVYDSALQWQNLPAASKSAVLAYVHQRGAKLVVSAGGATELVDTLMQRQYSGQAYGESVGRWAVANSVDGIDFDLEFTPGASQYLVDGSGVAWIAAAHQAARRIVGPGLLISHAPQGPYLGQWAAGGYVKVYEAVKGDIDFLSIQYYNQGAGVYTTFADIFVKGSNAISAGTAIAEIAAAGIPLQKLVVGKFVCAGCGGSGFVDASTMAGFVQKARQQLGWSGGFMAWAYLAGLGSGLETWGSAMSGAFGQSPPPAPQPQPQPQPQPSARPCQRKCQGKTCGPDGCGGQCGVCGRNQTCEVSQCVRRGSTQYFARTQWWPGCGCGAVGWKTPFTSRAACEKQVCAAHLVVDSAAVSAAGSAGSTAGSQGMSVASAWRLLNSVVGGVIGALLVVAVAVAAVVVSRRRGSDQASSGCAASSEPHSAIATIC